MEVEMTSEEIRKYNEARQILKELGHPLTGATRSDVLAWVNAEGYEWTDDGWKPRQRRNISDLEYWLEEVEGEAWDAIVEGDRSFVAGKTFNLVRISQRAIEKLKEADEIIAQSGIEQEWLWKDYVINGKPEVQE
jgi:hypothetical protein